MNEFAELFNRLLSGPASPEKEFIAGGHTYGDVYSMAAGLLEQFSSPGKEAAPVCLCTEDHGIIAAALVASLAGGPVFILPYSLSPQALEETRSALEFDCALIGPQLELPPGVSPITPARGYWKAPRPGAERRADDLFMTLFTGGSTGAPKAWSKTPVNLFAEASYQAEKYNFNEADLVAATVPPYHIYGLLYTVMAPFLGASTVLPGTYVFPREIASIMKNRPVTILVSVPVHYRVLNGTEIDAPKLRLAFSSAGPLDKDDATAFYRQTGVGPEEIYGSTETGGIACKSSATGRDILEPFECLEWKISDERLCVRSPFVSPDLPVDAQGFFVTGDRAAAAEGGRITLLGRVDGVVKVGGKRVDLNDVREKIKKIAGVRDAFLAPLTGRRGRETDIIAVIETDLKEEELRRVLSGALEQYAVPRRIRIVDTMPSTSTGKYDREAIMKLFDSERE
ncbi:MAG: acyl--CoA ligase [Spirochaetes bacterium]|nr:acyl--CoA ligase [Spirochaetota bacterium]